jgi:hypothetical protein
MNKPGWIKTELKIGRPRWHYFDVQKSDQGDFGKRRVSLCGLIRLYNVPDTETRHIMEAGNCLTCVRILKKKETAGNHPVAGNPPLQIPAKKKIMFVPAKELRIRIGGGE